RRRGEEEVLGGNLGARPASPPEHTRRNDYWTGIVEVALGICALAPVGTTPIENATLPVATPAGTWNDTIQTPTRCEESCTAVTATPPTPPIPAITVYTEVTVPPGAGRELVPTGGVLGPRPVANATSVSPLRAGFWMLTKEPSGRTRTGCVALSDISVRKM